MAKVLQIKDHKKERIKLEVDDKEIDIIINKKDGMIFVSVKAPSEVIIKHEELVFGKWWGKQ